MRTQIRATALLGVMGAALALTACGTSNSETSSASSRNTFALSEFTIVPPANELRAGKLSLTANNVGAETHELVIVRADSASAVPLKTNGSVDEAKIADVDKLGEITDVSPGSRRSKTFELSRGSYLAFCNIVDKMGSGSTMNQSGMDSAMGHIHFAQGMYVSFSVR